MSKPVLIETKSLYKFFGKRKVIDDLNLSVETGDIYGFLGPNGSGKTTTIRMLLGLVFPTKGKVYLNGYDTETELEKGIEKIGAIVENPSFYTYLSGRDNLQLMANLHPGLPKSRVDEVLEVAKLKGREKDKVKTYSLGMRQRLGIAMALLNKPQLIILDEPTNGLDPQGMKEVKELITDLASTHNITFFISSHLLNEVEQISTKVGVLKEGQLIAQGDVKELLKTNYEVIEVTTADKEKALDILKSAEFVKSVVASEKGVVVEMNKGNSSLLNQTLMSNGINVSLLTQQGNTLEKFFFDVMGGQKK